MIIMNGRKILGIIAAVFVFFGLGSIIALSVTYLGGSAGDPIVRIVGLFICFVMASFVYYRIKCDEPEPEIKEKQGITSEEISKKLVEKRKERI